MQLAHNHSSNSTRLSHGHCVLASRPPQLDNMLPSTRRAASHSTSVYIIFRAISDAFDRRLGTHELPEPNFISLYQTHLNTP